MVDIKGLDKAEVLLALWKGSHYQGLSFLALASDGVFTIYDAKTLIEKKMFNEWRRTKEWDENMPYSVAELDGKLTNEFYEWCKEEHTFSMYFDYVNGHVIKCDIGGDSFDERLYDRDCGEGHAAAVIEALRKGEGDYTPQKDGIDEPLTAFATGLKKMIKEQEENK